jgi:hypothetical protein
VTPEEKEKAIRRVIWGRQYITVESGNNQSVNLQVRSLTTREHAEADALRDRLVRQNKAMGILTEQELLKELEFRSMWSKADDESIKNIRAEAKRLYNDANTIHRFDKHKKGRDESKARVLEQMAAKVENKKWDLLSISAEHMGDLERSLWILQKVTYNEDGSALYWGSLDKLRAERDRKLVVGVLNQYAQSLFTQKDIREVARSPQWRYRWNSAKNNVITLFGVGFDAMTCDADMLVYWSQIYDSAFECMERPDDITIENDKSFDDWFDAQAKKSRGQRFNQQTNKGGNKKQRGEKTVSREETFILIKDAESAKEIAEMANDPGNVQLKADIEKIIKKGGMVSEKDLRFRK